MGDPSVSSCKSEAEVVEGQNEVVVVVGPKIEKHSLKRPCPPPQPVVLLMFQHKQQASLEEQQVQYPSGYNPQKRRYCVSSESIDPHQLKDMHIKKIPKSESVRGKLRQIVQTNLLFKRLNDEERDEVIDSMDKLELQPDQIVIKQGAFLDQNDMYVVELGELEVLYGNDVVATLCAGSGFGEIALMYGCPRTATIRTKTCCSLWTLDRNTFRKILMEESLRRRKLYESVLAKVSVFKVLLPYERTKVADALESVVFNDKEVIIRQGSTDTSKFYIIEKGEVICTKQDDRDGPPVFSSRLKAGDYFGELALLRNEPRQATVTAHGQVKCLTIDREHFDQVIAPCEEIFRRNMVNYKTYEELLSALKVVSCPLQVMESDVRTELMDLPAHREDILRYLLQNVREYLNNLRQTSTYMNTLKKQSTQIKINEQQISSIFSNFEEILGVHQKFDHLFHSFTSTTPNNSNNNEEELEVGALFLQLAPSLCAYEKFVKDFPDSLKIRSECSLSNTLFTDFLMVCHKEIGESLESLLEQIYMRVPQLVVILEHLLEATDISHPDKNTLALALRKIEKYQILKKIYSQKPLSQTKPYSSNPVT